VDPSAYSLHGKVTVGAELYSTFKGGEKMIEAEISRKNLELIAEKLEEPENIPLHILEDALDMIQDMIEFKKEVKAG